MLSLITLVSCGGSDKLDIKGDPEAIKIAEDMLKAMGGKKAWFQLKSVYVRTLSRVASVTEPYIYEEWINIDEPKLMNRKVLNDTEIVDIIDGNDGWQIQGSSMNMIPPQRITSYLHWHKNYFIRVVKDLAEEQENIEVKKTDNGFEVYKQGDFLAGFELNEANLPIGYYTESLTGQKNKIFFKEFSEYEGYKFPLLIEAESMIATYQTDYFDPSNQDAAKAFNISFNPHEMIK
jgi:hypothetical protein